MKRIDLRFSLLVAFAGVFLILSSLACKKEDENTDNTPPPTGPVYNPTAYEFEMAAHFPNFVVPDFNPTTEEGVDLGKRIYYDEMLSVGGPLDGKSCATCHLQTKNFANNESGVSVMPHTNLNWTKYWLWNGGKAGTLEDVMLFEIVDFFQADIDLFKSDTTYQRMCFEAFGTKDITEKEMSYALAQWERTHISSGSKYDRFKINGPQEYTLLEQLGYEVFNKEVEQGGGDCFHCHSEPLMTDLLFHNNGLDSIPTGFDLGRFNVTDDPADKGKFKTPSLRNVAVTGPYMHDGRYQTLEEVVEFYNSGVKHSNTLDPLMTKAGKEYGLQLTETNKAALIAFLNTLTDSAYLNNPEFADPFE